ncbi:MAG: hypothetical protein CMH57_10810 [Myxococcales bacterium]|nr:hypothetical protein [Myxococcales bacterium]
MGKQVNGLLNAEQFMGLARRCGFTLTPATLSAMVEHKFIAPLGSEESDRYAPAHLWLISRYFQAITIHRHPWREAGMVDEDALLGLKVDALVLNTLVEGFYVEDGPTPELAPPQEDMIERLGGFVEQQDPLGALGELLPYLRPELRSRMRGEALMVELLRDLLTRIWRQTDSATALEALGGASRLGPNSEPERLARSSYAPSRSRPLVGPAPHRRGRP